MVDNKIAFEITTDTSQTEKSVKSIKTELREATQEALNLSRKFGDTSKEALAAQQKVANLKDDIGDFKQRVDALNPDAKFRAFSQSLQGVAGGFAGLQGAIGLFGTESKDLEKQLLKVQSALALSEGLNSILESKDAFKNLGIVGVKAFQSIKVAIGSTGIGLLLVALGTIVAYWDDIKESISGVSQEQLKLNKQTEKNVQSEKDKLTEIDSQSEILKQQGVSEKDILKLKETQTQEIIKQQIIQLEGIKAVRDAEVKKTTDLYSKTVSAVSSFAGTAAGLSIANLFFNPADTIKKGDENIKEIDKQLTESKNKLAGYQNQVKVIDEKTVKDNSEKNEKIIEAEKIIQDSKNKLLSKQKQEEIAIEEIYKEKLKKIKLAGIKDDGSLEEEKKRELFLIKQKYIKQEADADAEIELQAIEAIKQVDQQKSDIKDASLQKDVERASSAAQIVAQGYKIDKEQLEEDKKNYAARIFAQESFLQTTASVFGQLSTLFGEGTAASKAAGLAEIAIQTGVGFANGLRIAQESAKATGPAAAFAFPIFYATQIGAVLAAASKAKSILSKVKGGGGGGSNISKPSYTGGGSIGSASINTPIAPIQSGVAVQQTSSVGTTNVNLQNQQAIKAFVVESDITDSQDRINKIKAAATI